MNAHREPPSYLEDTRSILSSPRALAWLTTLDHKRLGVLYLVASSLAMMAAGVLRLGLHQDLASSTVVAFLFLVPSLPATLGNFLLPLQLGQSRAALPRVSLAGFWLYVVGAAIILAGIGVTHGGNAVEAGALPMVVGALVLGLSASVNSINLLATFGKGLARRIPSSRFTLFAWSLCATSVANILGTVVLFGVLLLLGLGGLHLFPGFLPLDIRARLLANPWAYLCPASTLMLVPAVGLASDILATFARRSLAGSGLVATSFTALAFLTLVAWGFPLLGGGDSNHEAAMQFGLATSLLSVPLAVVVICWVATLQGGRISLDAPMLWALGFVVQLSVGGLAGLLLGVPPSSIYLHGTNFEVGYRDYLLTGGASMGFLAGVYYAWPKLTGKLYDARVAKLAFLLVFVGVQVTFLSEMVSGELADVRVLAELPRYGSWVLALGVLVTVLNLTISFRSAVQCPRNPWGAIGLEWTTTSPPPLDNFLEDPDGLPVDGQPEGLPRASALIEQSPRPTA